MDHVTTDLNKVESPSSSSRDDQRKEDRSSVFGGKRKEGDIPSSSSIHDQRGKKQCTSQWMKSPKCCVWDEGFTEIRTSNTECGTMKETMMKIEEVKNNISERDSSQENGMYNDGAWVASTANYEQQISNAKLTQSQAVWESDSLQDIARVYLGNLCPKSSFGKKCD